MPDLIKLTLADNELTDFTSLSNLPHLKSLNLRKNQIATLQDVPGKGFKMIYIFTQPYHYYIN